MVPDPLFAPVREDPNNHDAWMVLADALMEDGDPRGELIVLERAGPDTAEARARGMAIWHDVVGRTRLPAGVRLRWQHGFVVGATQQPFEGLDTGELATVLRDHPVLGELAVGPWPVTADEVARVAEVPGIEQISVLEVGGTSVEAAHLRPILRLLEVAGPRSFVLQAEHLPPGAGDALAASPALGRVVELASRLPPEATAALVASPYLRTRVLRLQNADVDTWEALVEARTWPLCRVLELTLPVRSTMGGADRHLAAFRAIVSSAPARQLEFLSMPIGAHPNAMVEALVAEPWPALQHLQLFRGIRDIGMTALAKADVFPALTCLALPQGHVEDDGILALTSSTTLPRLRRLDLSSCGGITSTSLEALATTASLPKLEDVRVSFWIRDLAPPPDAIRRPLRGELRTGSYVMRAWIRATHEVVRGRCFYLAQAEDDGDLLRYATSTVDQLLQTVAILTQRCGEAYIDVVQHGEITASHVVSSSEPRVAADPAPLLEVLPALDDPRLQPGEITLIDGASGPSLRQGPGPVPTDPLPERTDFDAVMAHAGWRTVVHGHEAVESPHTQAWIPY